MSTTVCLCANCIGYPEGGGHLWVYLNWALGLRAAGCNLVWLERVGGPQGVPPAQASAQAAKLSARLAPFGLADALAVCNWSGEPLPAVEGCLGLDAALSADLLLNFVYSLPAAVVGRFRRSAMVDIDPGLLQTWIACGDIEIARHDVLFTTGEAIGRPWHYTPPCVALDWWTPTPAPAAAPFTTVSHWYGDEWVNDGDNCYRNDKRSGFLPYLDLPSRTGVPLELALCLGDGDAEEQADLRGRGWHVREAWTVVATPGEYQNYVRGSRGEFSCAKPSTVRMQNAWVSDRTLCYLASGRPAVVQHTGPSRFLPDAAGLFRFSTPDEAATALETAASDYDRHSRLARELVAEHFDARAVARRVLEIALA